MEKTLAAVFDDESTARQALQALMQNGFSSSNARIASNERASLMAAGTTHADHDESFGEKVSRFFGFGEKDETTYSEAVRRGGCVLIVDASSDDEAERAEDIIEKYDPIDIDEREAQWRAGSDQGHEGAATTIPIVEEQMQVGKRVVQKGGVRVVSRVTERPVEEKIYLHEEHATIKRRPADRAVTESDKAFKDQSFEVRGTAEEAIVSKTARVVEEVVVGKESSSRDQIIKDSVRKTDVDVEQLGKDGVAHGNGHATTRPTAKLYSGAERRKSAGANRIGTERRAV